MLVRGESGSGKELVARAIHRASHRADRPMISVNCAAIPADLMESQLFGHKAGSFTGADRDHIGFFQQADLGTLFLDEVGELTLEGQAKLLRILEGHPFLPVGATQEVSVDVRVIAATNQDLQTYVREKKFREDLYYRLSVFELHLPPLRDRGDDIGLLIDFFLDHFRRQHGRPSLELTDAGPREAAAPTTGPATCGSFATCIDSAVVLADDEEIQPARPGPARLRQQQRTRHAADRRLGKTLILEALNRTGDNVPEAAKLLGIGRATLYRKIEQYPSIVTVKPSVQAYRTHKRHKGHKEEECNHRFLKITSFVSFVPSWFNNSSPRSAPLREIFLSSSIATLLILTSTASAANWDRFRGPNGAGQSDDTGIPTKWEPANFLWKQPLAGVGHSSPRDLGQPFVPHLGRRQAPARKSSPPTTPKPASPLGKGVRCRHLSHQRPQQLRIEHSGR